MDKMQILGSGAVIILVGFLMRRFWRWLNELRDARKRVTEREGREMTVNLWLFGFVVAGLAALFVPRLVGKRKVERWDDPIDPFVGNRLGADVVALVIQPEAFNGGWIVCINRGTAIGLAGAQQKSEWLCRKLADQLRHTDHDVWRVLATYHPHCSAVDSGVQRSQIPRMVFGDILDDLLSLLNNKHCEVRTVEMSHFPEEVDGYVDDLFPDGSQAPEVREGVRS